YPSYVSTLSLHDALPISRRRFRGIGLLDSLVDLPIVLPPAVAGLALLLTFGRRGLLGGPLASLGIELPFTTAAVVNGNSIPSERSEEHTSELQSRGHLVC